MPKKIAVIFGTRPEAIKVAPVILALKNHSQFQPVVVVTGQHRQMLDQVLSFFQIKPDIDLNMMQAQQTLPNLTAKLLRELTEALKQVQPNLVLVQGDTTSTFAGALAAFYQKIPIGHIEAGLRSYQKYHPFPEEINRKLVSSLADFHFAPTQTAKNNLIKEGINPKQIVVTGNTVIDSLLWLEKKSKDKPLCCLPTLKEEQKLVLITTHRRENWDGPVYHICEAIRSLRKKYPQTFFLFSLHLNPKVQSVVKSMLAEEDGVFLTNPLDYLSFIQVLRQSSLVLTDSGGIQEEAPTFGKPVLVLREVTERPEAVRAGTVRVIGTKKEKIVSEVSFLFDNKEAYQQMAQAVNPYGDGQAAKRIVQFLEAA